MIFSGKRRKRKDGAVVGYRIVKGGRGFRWPIVESVHTISLEAIQVEMKLTGALTKSLVPVNVEGQ